jgi:hypothetical protein
MKFYTTTIDVHFFNRHIKENIYTSIVPKENMNCYVIDVIVPVMGAGELWVCDIDSSFYPTILCPTDCVKKQYERADFFNMLPDLHRKEILKYLEMIRPTNDYSPGTPDYVALEEYLSSF